MDQEIRDKYQAVIGLEVHIQLLTRSKLFAGDSNRYGDEPNTNVSIITLAHPGTLPKLNKKALELAVKMGLACHSTISQRMIFDRKNYFYPDLPKGYQLTQDSTPICVGGRIGITTHMGEREIELNRIHLEEDAGKSFHPHDAPESLVDFNRAGTPLIELVTEPTLHQAEEAYRLLAEIRKMVRFLEICDGNMEQGSLRCDANVSVRPAGSKELGPKVEIKNMNSLRNVRRAIKHEVERQISLLESGHTITSETRSFQEKTGGSVAMRTKEELNDYRYFPDPDLSPVEISDHWLQQIKGSMPKLPHQLKMELHKDYGFSAEDVELLTESPEMYEYYTQTLEFVMDPVTPLNWLKGPIRSYTNDANLTIAELSLSPKKLGELIALVEEGAISFSQAAQKLLPKLLQQPHSKPRDTAASLGLLQIKDENILEEAVVEILKAFPDKVESFKNGKKGLLGFFMGQLMQRTDGNVDPKLANELFSKYLN